jgi:ParB/RepB/Spo0J family partition protein
MPSDLKLPSDFAAKIAETLNWKLAQVTDTFEIEEGKDGYFYARLKPKKWLDKPDFKTLCVLVRDLGGEGYLEGMKCRKLAGPYAKKGPIGPQEKPSGHGIDSEPAHKGPGNAIPMRPKPEEYFAIVPIRALFGMQLFKPRQTIDPEFEDLVDSIKTIGILEPLLVRPGPQGMFEIVAGDRRFRAAQKAGLAEVPVIAKPLEDREALEIQLIENVQRKDLADIEKAHALDNLIKKYGYTQEQVGRKLGKTQGWVSQHLAMLKIPESITRVIKSPQIGELTEGQAREILSAPEDKIGAIVDRINETGEVPTVKEIHEIVHPQKTLLCAHCGDPIKGPPVHIKNSFYCLDCAEQIQAESVPSTVTEEHVSPFEAGSHDEMQKEPEPETSRKRAPKPEPKLTGYAWTCPDCGKKYIINHVDYPDSEVKDHVLEACGE